MKRILTTLALGLTLVAAGCAELQDAGIATRNKNAAYSAWKRAKWDYFREGVPYFAREHLGRGFQQGYYDVASGGSGQVPLFPPNYYWGVTYQNPRGTQLIGAWFRGYQDGTMAAERDGLARYNTLPSSWAPPYPPGTNPQAMTETGEPVPPAPGLDVIPPLTHPSDLPIEIPDTVPPMLQPSNPPLIRPKTVDPSAALPPSSDVPVVLTPTTEGVEVAPLEGDAATPPENRTEARQTSARAETENTALQQTLFVNELTGELPFAESMPVAAPEPTKR